MRLHENFEGKTTEELYELLAQSFDVDSDDPPDVECIEAILDIIKEREPSTEEIDVEGAWESFCEFVKAMMEEDANNGTEN